MIFSLRKSKITQLIFVMLAVFFLVSAGVFLVSPSISLAQETNLQEAQTRGIVPIVPCNTADTCNYNALITGVQRLLSFLITAASIIAVVLFVYAGFLLIFSGGNPSKRDRAKEIFWNTIVGFIIVISAWLIIATVLKVFKTQIDTPLESIDTTV